VSDGKQQREEWLDEAVKSLTRTHMMRILNDTQLLLDYMRLVRIVNMEDAILYLIRKIKELSEEGEKR